MNLLDRARELDAADPIAWARDRFVPAEGVVYLDGNSLGRPLQATADRLADLVTGAWGTRLIRSWDESWMDLPLQLGDRLGATCLGAAPGQTFIGDSTTVLLYKLLRAAVAHGSAQGRTEIVLDRGNFPTDRYVAQAVAEETGAQLVWIEPDPDTGVTPQQIETVLGERTAVVLLSHVSYTSAWIADLPTITQMAHSAGALVLWDLCHSVGAVRSDLDLHQVDLAVGCSYKFLNGGPGAPAFGYVAQRWHGVLQQPISGWMGHARPFEMGPTFESNPGVRGCISGTPSILAMVGIEDTVDLIDEVGLDALRDKGIGLGEFVIEAADSVLAHRGVRVLSPRAHAERGNHVTLGHPRARELVTQLWERDVIPDFREPDRIRLGLSPLSTSYTEVAEALLAIEQLTAER